MHQKSQLLTGAGSKGAVGMGTAPGGPACFICTQLLMAALLMDEAFNKLNIFCFINKNVCGLYK